MSLASTLVPTARVMVLGVEVNRSRLNQRPVKTMTESICVTKIHGLSWQLLAILICTVLFTSLAASGEQPSATQPAENIFVEKEWWGKCAKIT